MWLRCGVLAVLFAGGCSCEAKRASPPPPPLEVDRISVPGTRAPGRPAGQSIPRATDRSLLAEEANLAIEGPPAMAPGVETTARVRVTAKPGFEINEKFHYKLTLEPTPGITLPKTVFTEAAHDAERLDSHELAIAMKLTADVPG